jgi:K+-transporting ATPase ATPase C chain
MRKDLTTGLIAIVLMTVTLGLLYPLAITGISQLAFPGQADGSLVKVDGRVVGSSLIGQEFKGESYFHSRPSATGYSGNVTFFDNAGPNSKEAREEVRGYMEGYLRLEKPFDRALTGEDVPVDAVTQSASGVDPHVSEANARIQAHRIAAVRRLSLGQVEDLISTHTDGRSLGLLGEPGVNVLELNLALDEAAPLRRQGTPLHQRVSPGGER